MDDPRILVIGPGALGALFAARIEAAGIPVTVAARTKKTATHIREHGLVAEGPDGGRVHVQVPALWHPKRLDGITGVVLATKCAAAVPALEAWLPGLDDDVPVVALQNGIMGDTLRSHIGDRLMACTVAFPATLEGTAHSVQTGPGDLHVGPWPGGDPADHKVTQACLPWLRTVAPTREEANMAGVQWTKLLVNSCITTLGALTGQGLGELLPRRRARQAFLAIVREGHHAGLAAGVMFEPVGGFRPGLFARPVPGRHMLLKAIGRKYRGHRSSSLQSLGRGQKTEVDFLNGHIVHAARMQGLEAPVNEAVTALVHRIEEGGLDPSPDLLKRLPL